MSNAEVFLKDSASVQDAQPLEKRAWAKMQCFIGSFLPVVQKLLSLWEGQIDSKVQQRRAHDLYQTLIDVTELLFLLAQNDKWVLPLIIGHDMICLERNSCPNPSASWNDLVDRHEKQSCCSRHAAPLLLGELFETVELLQDTLFCWDEVFGSKETASKEQALIRIKKIQSILEQASYKVAQHIRSAAGGVKI